MILMQINNCKNIIEVKDVIRTTQHYYIIFEYCAGGDLAGYLKKKGHLPEKQVRNFMKQIVNGLKPLNKLRIVHRDLKLSNFLLSDDSDNPTVMICDFGLARQKTSKEASMMFNTLCGTPMYMAPEVLNGNKYDERADLWSMGTILYELLIGNPPFQGKSLPELIENINKGRYIIPSSFKISKPCLNLISGLLISDPKKRFTWKDLFNHPFISEADEEEDAKREESEFSELDSQNISIIKKHSLEKVKEIEDECTTTENGDEFEFISRGRTSDLTDKNPNKLSPDENNKDEKQSNSDNSSEELALKSSSTEYNFYNSDESRYQSAMSSNSSNIQPIKKFGENKNINSTLKLKVVKEVSNGAIEEDPDEDIKTSKENSTGEHLTDQAVPPQSIDDDLNHLVVEESPFSNDIPKIKDFMKDLIRRSNMIMSFYDEIYLDGINGISKFILS